MASLGTGKHIPAAGQANAHTFAYFPRRAVGKKHLVFFFWLILFFFRKRIPVESSLVNKSYTCELQRSISQFKIYCSLLDRGLYL